MISTGLVLHVKKSSSTFIAISLLFYFVRFFLLSFRHTLCPCGHSNYTYLYTFEDLMNSSEGMSEAFFRLGFNSKFTCCMKCIVV